MRRGTDSASSSHAQAEFSIPALANLRGTHDPTKVSPAQCSLAFWPSRTAKCAPAQSDTASCRLLVTRTHSPLGGGLSLISLTPRPGELPSSDLNSLQDPLLLRHWFLIAWSGDIAPGGILPCRLLGGDLVLWRSSAKLHCWLDLCVHRGARLSLGLVRPQTPHGRGHLGSDCLACPYYGWEYAESGRCVRLPAHPDLVPRRRPERRPTRFANATGRWVCLGETKEAPPEFPFAETPGFRTVLTGPYRFRALGPRVIENALDVVHLGYGRRTFRSRSQGGSHLATDPDGTARAR